MKKIAGKKLLGILLALVLVIGLVPCAGMTANADDLIRIGSADELKKIGKDAAYPLSGNYRLTADVSMDTMIAGEFTGVFDGYGHTVTLSINHPEGQWNTGLFENVSGTVRNLITDGSVTCVRGNVGAIAAHGSGTFSRCWNRASVSGTSVAGASGIVGFGAVGGPTVTDCLNTGVISGATRIGGIICSNADVTATVTRCFSSECSNFEATAHDNGAFYIVGGDSPNMQVTDCYFAGSVDHAGSNQGKGTKLSGQDVANAEKYANWDFTNTWMMKDGSPRLRMPVEAPAFTPDGGELTAAQSVTLSCATKDAVMYYTTDGTEPTTGSTVYTSAITLTATATVKAIAVKDGVSSEVASATFTLPVPELFEADNTVDVSGTATEDGVKLESLSGEQINEINKMPIDKSVNLRLSGNPSQVEVPGVLVEQLDLARGKDGRVCVWMSKESGGTQAWYGLDSSVNMLRDGVTMKIDPIVNPINSDKLTLQQANALTQNLDTANDYRVFNIEASFPTTDGRKLEEPVNFNVGDIAINSWPAANVGAYYMDNDGNFEKVGLSFKKTSTLTGSEGSIMTSLKLDHFSVYVLVNKSQFASVTMAPEARTLTYTGFARSLVTAGEAEGGTMYYALTTTAAAPDASAYSETIPTAARPGTYYVWYKAVGDVSHADTQPVSVMVTISGDDSTGASAPGALTVTSQIGAITRVTVDGKTVDSKYYTVSGSNVVLSDAFMASLSNGTHTIRLYDGVTYATATWTVTGNAATITAPKTADPGLALYAALAASAALGLAWTGKKKAR